MNRDPEFARRSGARPKALADLRLPAALRVAVLAPHPDDFDVIAVTLRFLHRNGNRIDVAVLTSGASGVEDGYRGATMAGAKRAIREEEQRASARYFGLPEERLTFLRLSEHDNGELIAGADNLDRTRNFFVERRPDLVFLPHGNDSNPDHQRTYAIFREIVRLERAAVTAFLNRDPKTVAMRTDVYTGFDEATAAWKAGLLRCHQSQQQRNLNTRKHGFDERILGLNRQYAAGCDGAWPYAETFEVEHYRRGSHDTTGG